MSNVAASRSLAIRLVDAMKRDGFDCSMEIGSDGMPIISIVETMVPSVQRITFELEVVAGDQPGEQHE